MNEQNSLFERSNNPGETYNIDEILAPVDHDEEILLNDVEELPFSIKELYKPLGDSRDNEIKKKEIEPKDKGIPLMKPTFFSKDDPQNPKYKVEAANKKECTVKKKVKSIIAQVSNRK